MNRLQKKEFVAALNKDFKESNLLVITHYSGLNVKELEELRSKMRESEVKFKVAKNRLAKLSLPGTSFEKVSELFKGPTAIAYSGDPIKAAKIAVDFSKTNKKLKIIGGSFEGKIIEVDQVKFLASLPSLDEVRSKIISILQAPASKVLTVINAPGSQIVRLLKSHSEKTA